MGVLRVSGVVDESIVDGPGIRFVIFAQGCHRRCPGCHNPQTFDPLGGYQISIDEIVSMIEKNPILQGVTFSGGEPFLQAASFAVLAKKLRQIGLNIIVYTGYTFEELLASCYENPDWRALLESVDTVVDGPFEIQRRSLELRFRGSNNQRVLDIAQSLARGVPIERDFDAL